MEGEKTPSVCCADTSPGSPGEENGDICLLFMRVAPVVLV